MPEISESVDQHARLRGSTAICIRCTWSALGEPRSPASGRRNGSRSISDVRRDGAIRPDTRANRWLHGRTDVAGRAEAASPNSADLSTSTPATAGIVAGFSGDTSRFFAGTTATASEPARDEAARREIQRLEQSIQSLQRQLRDVGKAPESSQELQSLQRTVEELKAAAAKTAAAAGSQLQKPLPVTPILTPEAPPGPSSGLLALALKVGTTLLLPEVAIPTGAISIAATVGGWWLGRRRRNQRQWIPNSLPRPDRNKTPSLCFAIPRRDRTPQTTSS